MREYTTHSEYPDELHGFTPFDEGTALVVSYSEETVRFANKFADDEDKDGWDWGLGITDLNTLQVKLLRDNLSEWLDKNG